LSGPKGGDCREGSGGSGFCHRIDSVNENNAQRKEMRNFRNLLRGKRLDKLEVVMSEIVKLRRRSARPKRTTGSNSPTFALPASPALSGSDFLRPIAATQDSVPPMPGAIIRPRRVRRVETPHLRLVPRTPSRD
jgi:hypothetical protein